MPGKISLFVPGPTNMPDRVRQSMDISNEDHRAPGMEKLWHPLIDDLKKFLKQNLLSHSFFQEQVVADGKRRLQIS